MTDQNKPDFEHLPAAVPVSPQVYAGFVSYVS